MLRLRLPSFYLTLVIFLASCAWISGAEVSGAKTLRSGQASSFNVEGKINSLGENKLTLNSEENMIFHVNYDEKTQFKSDDGSPASSKDLRVGLRIRVAGDFTESGEIAAASIEVVKAPAKK